MECICFVCSLAEYIGGVHWDLKDSHTLEGARNCSDKKTERRTKQKRTMAPVKDWLMQLQERKDLESVWSITKPAKSSKTNLTILKRLTLTDILTLTLNTLKQWSSYCLFNIYSRSKLFFPQHCAFTTFYSLKYSIFETFYESLKNSKIKHIFWS